MAYGAEVFRADGTLQLATEGARTTFRLVAQEVFAFNDGAPVRGVPAFSENLGVFQYTDHVDPTPGGIYLTQDVWDAPTLVWDEIAKTITYSPPTTAISAQQCAITVNFYHFR